MLCFSHHKSCAISHRLTVTFGFCGAGLGILWLTRNSKLICAGFAPGSPAKAAGVKSGDILKSVDGADILQVPSFLQESLDLPCLCLVQFMNIFRLSHADISHV